MSEQHRLECEARYWRKWVRQNGRAKWEQTKKRIRKRRGYKGLLRLLDEMNREVKI